MFIMEIPIKMDDLGENPLFQEIPSYFQPTETANDENQERPLWIDPYVPLAIACWDEVEVFYVSFLFERSEMELT